MTTINPNLLAQAVGVKQAPNVQPAIEQIKRNLTQPEVNNSPNNPSPQNSNILIYPPKPQPVNPKPDTTITDTSVSALNRTISQPNVLQNIPSISDASLFTIKFVDNSNTEQIYKFSLLPAVESRLASGSQVPEVKPGILIKTSMNIKRFLVPGGSPMFQMLGAEQTMIQLVGLLIGNESLTANRVLPAKKEEENKEPEIVERSDRLSTLPNTSPTIPNLPPTPENIRKVEEAIKKTGEEIERNAREIEALEQQIDALKAGGGLDPVSSLYKEDPNLDSHAVAKKLDLSVVQLGKPVEIRIISHNSSPNLKPFELRYNCLLQSFRYFVARNDRTYYALDAIVLDYLTVTNKQIPNLSEDVVTSESNTSSTENKEVRQAE